MVKQEPRPDCNAATDLKMITRERILTLISVDPETGIIKRLRGRKNADGVAGSKNKAGYINILLDGKLYRAHRIVWFYVHGVWPPELDHENGDKSYNAIDNLREATRSQNGMNKPKQKNNTSGFKGVTFHSGNGLWHARIGVDGKRIGLGYFPTPELAGAAYKVALATHHQDFGRL